MTPAQPQLVIPTPDPRRSPLVIVGSHPHAGHLERCPDCGAEAWTAFGHATRLARACAGAREAADLQAVLV